MNYTLKKPLKLIKGKPMIEHVFERAKMYKKWSSLSLATCDTEIKEFSKSKKYNCIMTSINHTRCLDRVFEASNKIKNKPKHNDIIVCVQGDEPLINPDLIDDVTWKDLNLGR